MFDFLHRIFTGSVEKQPEPIIIERDLRMFVKFTDGSIKPLVIDGKEVVDLLLGMPKETADQLDQEIQEHDKQN